MGMKKNVNGRHKAGHPRVKIYELVLRGAFVVDEPFVLEGLDLNFAGLGRLGDLLA
jgi:hypothetical protein